MRSSDVARLVALAAIWSLSMVFVRVLAEPLGPVWIATLRMLIAGVALCAFFAIVGYRADVRAHWRAYLFVGAINSAAPFVLFAWAAQTLPASYLVVLNTAAPMFTALLAALVLGEPLGAAKGGGLVVGAIGVALVSGAGPLAPTPAVLAAVAASLAGALCYAIAGLWLKRHGAGLEPQAMAGWSQLFAGAAMLPIALPFPIPGPMTPWGWANLAALALLCSAVAYLLYFRLIRDIGPTRAMTVTFLMPALGMLWGVLFLDERVTTAMLAGAALVVAGTIAVLRPARAVGPSAPGADRGPGAGPDGGGDDAGRRVARTV
jgi:drug/metabolite transporter (DMT)-like permease